MSGSGWPSPFAFPDAGAYHHPHHQPHLPSPSAGSASWQAHELALLGGLPLDDDGGAGRGGEGGGAADMDVLEEDGMGGTVILGRPGGPFVHDHHHQLQQQQQQQQQQAAQPSEMMLVGPSTGAPHHPALVNNPDHDEDDDDEDDDEDDEEAEDDSDGEGDSDGASSAATAAAAPRPRQSASAGPDGLRRRGRSAAAAAVDPGTSSSTAVVSGPGPRSRSSPDRRRATSSARGMTTAAAAAAAAADSAAGPSRAGVARRASSTGPDDDAGGGGGGAKRKKRSRPSTGRAPGRPKDDLIGQLAVVREDTGRLHCIAERCTQTWSSRTPLRIKHHASVCPHLPSATRAVAADAYRHAMNKAAERRAAKEGISFVDSDEDPPAGGPGRPASSGGGARGRSAGEMEVDERPRPRSAGPARPTSSSAGPSSAAGVGGPSTGVGSGRQQAGGPVLPSVPAAAAQAQTALPPPPPARTDSAPAVFTHALQRHPAPAPSVHQTQHLQHPHHFQQHQHQQRLHAPLSNTPLGGQRAESSLGLPTFPLPFFEQQQQQQQTSAYAHALPPPSSMHSNGAAAADSMAAAAVAVTSPAASISGLSSGSSGSLGGILNHFAPVGAGGHARYPSLGPSFLPTTASRAALFHRPASNLTLANPGSGGGAATASSAGGAPSPPALKLSPPKPTKQKPLWRLLTSRAFDSAAQAWMLDRVFTVDSTTGLIVSVRTLESFGLAPDSEDVAVLEGVPTMDVRGLTIVPGFIDAHVHLFLHPYTEAPWQTQVQHESLVERTVRAVGHAKRTLMAGFTTVRDLGTEGALDADAHLKHALGPPLALAPAPRMFVASRAIVSTGSYGPRTQKWDDPGHEEAGQVVGAEVADGPAEIRKVVRRQLGRGADWIKVYADYPSRAALTPFSPRLASASHQTFTLDELRTVVETARAGGVKVAAHATRADTIRDCVTAGVSTIEHGYDADRRAFEMMKEHNVIWVPTLAAYQGSVTLLEHRSSNAQATFNLTGSRESEHLLRLELRELRLAEDRWARMKRAFKLALEVGVKIACGGDTGVFPHGDNSLEMQRMVGLGAPVLSVLAACTATGWESVRPSAFDGPSGPAHLAKWTAFAADRAATLAANLHSQPNWFVPLGPREAGEHEQPLGRLAPGFAADLVGLAGDVEAHFGAAVQAGVKLVVKGARVVQLDGVEMPAP